MLAQVGEGAHGEHFVTILDCHSMVMHHTLISHIIHTVHTVISHVFIPLLGSVHEKCCVFPGLLQVSQASDG